MTQTKLPSPLLLDGAQGEGGGQILRTSLVLSAICVQPIEIENIRANRSKPGLRPQHLTGVQAMASLCSAEVEGAQIGSDRLRFAPTVLPSGDHTIDIRTAGATSLLLHALYFGMAWSEAGGQLKLLGGTHAERAPTYDYIAQVWTPLIRLSGFEIDTTINSYGFYPKGGGQIEARIPGRQRGLGMDDFTWTQRPPLERIQIEALWAEPSSRRKKAPNIPARMAASARTRMLEDFELEPDIELRHEDARSAGAICSIFLHFGPLRAGFTEWGRKGVPAEQVGQRAAELALAFLHTDACLDPHSADQLLLPLALSGQAATYTTPECSRHLETNAAIIQQFLPQIEISYAHQSSSLTTVSIRHTSDRNK